MSPSNPLYSLSPEFCKSDFAPAEGVLNFEYFNFHNNMSCALYNNKINVC